jgi:hypothetical protein
LKSPYSEFSLSKHLRKNNKSSDEFEFMLNKLTLEELIALKLEVSSRAVSGKLYGFKLWNSIPAIAKEGALIFAISATRNLVEAQALLGVCNNMQFRKIVRRYKEVLNYYNVKQVTTKTYVKKIL